MTRERRGVTLIELVVVLAILGVIVTVTGLSMNTAAPVQSTDTSISQISTIRDSALKSGHAISTTIIANHQAVPLTAYPDGRVITTLSVVDRMTGRLRAPR